ncbi:MAG: MBL fold metallo-hydrolase [Spirochaetales bacterium]|nr:MBL fold metallo-hydrolase [Spirochaetales bacterium]
MKLFFHFVLSNFSNTYVIGPDDGGDAIIIDPGVMDLTLLNLIEKNNLYIKYILVTHKHRYHIGGIKTISKIYDAEVYSNMQLPFDIDFNKIVDGDKLQLGEHYVETYNVQGHSPDSMIFKINNMLFTGDTIYSGYIDQDLTIKQNQTLIKRVREAIFTLDDDILVFPGHGSPSTIKLEKEFNYHFK